MPLSLRSSTKRTQDIPSAAAENRRCGAELILNLLRHATLSSYVVLLPWVSLHVKNLQARSGVVWERVSVAW